MSIEVHDSGRERWVAVFHTGFVSEINTRSSVGAAMTCKVMAYGRMSSFLDIGRTCRYCMLMTIRGTWFARARRPVFIWALAALVTQLAVESDSPRQSATPTLGQKALLLAPLLPLLMFMVALVRMVRRMDELQQRICLESVFIAFAGSLSVAFVFSGLEEARVWRPPWTAIGTVMVTLWAVGYLYSSWKYR